MSKITSIDALIDRTKVAFPGWELRLTQIREYMEAGRHNVVYDLLANSGYSYHYRSFNAKDILDTIDEQGNSIEKKFAELVSSAKEVVAKEALEPIRRQLADDFKETYPEAELLDS